MKCLVKFLFCVLLANTASAQTDRKTANDSAKISGDWYLQPVLPSDTATGRIPNLSFDLAKRTFKGFTGCNQMTGSFRISGDAIEFGKDISVTKIACEGFNEKEFITNLLRVDHYQFRDGMLILLINKTPISKWMRRADKIMTTE
jgi:heat shock protein HslJ